MFAYIYASVCESTENDPVYISGMDSDTVKPLYIDFSNRQRLQVSY